MEASLNSGAQDDHRRDSLYGGDGPLSRAILKLERERDFNGGPIDVRGSRAAEAKESAEAHGDLKALVGTEHYRALSAPCRELVDAYVSLADKPAGAAADTAADRASAAEIERRFGASCVDGAPAAPAAASAATQLEDLREQTVLLEASLEAYRALSPQCRSYFDTFADARNRADVAPTDRERIAEAERLFKANCVDREAGAREIEKARTRLAEDDRRICAHKREQAAQVRALVNLTLAEEQEKPGTIDADKEERRKFVERWDAAPDLESLVLHVAAFVEVVFRPGSAPQPSAVPFFEFQFSFFGRAGREQE